MTKNRLARSFGASLLLLAACAGGGSELDREGNTTGTLGQAIVGGQTDREHSAVLAIAFVTRREEALCTGSLIAPNLVLTARHCVSFTEDEPVDCSESTFGTPHAPESLWVSPSTRVGASSFFPVREVLVPTGSPELCGSDIALLILDGQFVEGSITPIEPRLDEPAQSGESFTAVGFGDALDEGDPGIRRVLGGLQILCGEEDCNAPGLVTDREFVGEQAVCDGDSGGPALDEDGRVVGVASRATEGCEVAVYSAVVPWRDWILDGAARALELGDYAAPAWMNASEAPSAAGSDGPAPIAMTGSIDTAPRAPEVVEPEGTSPEVAPDLGGAAVATRSSSGCAVAAPASGSFASAAWLAPALLALAARVGRSRRQRRA